MMTSLNSKRTGVGRQQQCTQPLTSLMQPLQNVKEIANKLIEKSKYSSQVDLQTKHLKTVCDLLGDAQVVMQQISTKLNQAPNPRNICKCDKSMQLEVLELSKEKQPFKLDITLKDSLDQSNIGVQAGISTTKECNLQTCVDIGPILVEITNVKCEENLEIERVDDTDEAIHEGLLEISKENVEPNINQQTEVIDKQETQPETTSQNLLQDNEDAISLNIENKSISSSSNNDKVKEEILNNTAAMLIKIDNQDETKQNGLKELKESNQGETQEDNKEISKEMQIENVEANSENYDINLEDTQQNDDGDNSIKENNETIKYTKPDDFINVDVSMTIQSKKINFSTRNNLSIQMMPHIDIQRGLVVQKIPMDIIDSNESFPQLDTPEDSNIKYEIIKHYSNTIFNENRIKDKTKDNKIDCNNIKPQTQESGVQTDKIQIIEDFNAIPFVKDNDIKNEILKQTDQTSIQNKTNTSCNINLDTSFTFSGLVGPKSNTTFVEKEIINTLLFPASSPLSLNTHKSAISDKIEQGDANLRLCNNILDSFIISTFQKESSPVFFVHTEDQISEGSSVRTNLNFDETLPDIPIETYINKKFQPETESEQLLDVKKNIEEEVLSCRSIKTGYVTPSIEPTKSNLVGLIINEQDQQVEEYLNEIIKDPTAEVLLKSYQILQDQKIHEPETTVDVSQLTFIDEEVYQTFVNPEGFKVIESSQARVSLTDDKPSHVINVEISRKPLCTTSEYKTVASNIKSKSRIYQRIHAKEHPMVVKMPSSFCSSKSVQCDGSLQDNENITDPEKVEDNLEITANNPKENENELVVIKTETEDVKSQKQYEKTENNDDDTKTPYNSLSSSSSCNSFDSECIWKINKTNVSGSQDDVHASVLEMAGSTINNLQNPTSYSLRSSRILADSLQSPLPFQPPKERASFANISHDIPKRLSAAITLTRNSVTRKLSQPVHSELRSAKRLVDTTPKKGILSPVVDSREPRIINANSNISLKSEDTEDIIFEIDRDNLKKSPQLNSKMDISDTSIHKKQTSSIRKESINSNKVNIEPDRSEYVITHDISVQTSLTDTIDTNSLQYSKLSIENGVILSEEDIFEKRSNNDSTTHTTCCSSLCRNIKKVNFRDAYIKADASTPQKSSLAHSTNSIIDRDDDLNASRKSVKIEEPLYIPQPLALTLPQKVLRRLSRKGITPVGSFITGLTSFNKDDIAIARNVPPENALSVFEKYSPQEIIHSIKSISDAAYSHYQHTQTADAICQTSREKHSTINNNSNNDQLDDFNTAMLNNDAVAIDTIQDNSNAENNDITVMAVSDSNAENNDVTVMAVSVEYPENAINEKFLKPLNPEDVQLLNKNVPGGDDTDYQINLEIPNNDSTYNHRFSPDYRKHEGIFPHFRKHRSVKKKCYETSLSETSESTSEKTEEVLSDGEVKCKCTASIGEIHTCPYVKKLRTAQYLKRYPQGLINHEFADPNMKIKRQRQFNSNWVAYYVSRSPSPELDNSEAFNSGTDSSGLVKKFM